MKWLAVFLGLLASDAVALSCLRPDVARTFNNANDIVEPVYILRGTLTFDERLMPQGVVNEPRDPAPVPALFKGLGLTLDGFTARFERPVTLQPQCAGPWCGSAVSGQEAIVFATVLGDDILINVGACGGQIFYDPTPQMEATLTSCIRGEACVSPVPF